jgi:acyl-coenzyme A thioesterase PaaI-like protein
MVKRLLKIFPEIMLANMLLRYFGFFKIPLLFFVRPSVVELSDQKVVVKIPLRRRTRNHLRSMYLGAMVVGADVAAGLMAMTLIQKSSQKVSLIFKSLDSEFFKRVQGDAYFTCVQGREISDLVSAAVASTERVEMPVEVTATVPSEPGDDPAARFTLVLSLKKR